jgi:hypothetical protein
VKQRPISRFPLVYKGYGSKNFTKAKLLELRYIVSELQETMSEFSITPSIRRVCVQRETRGG